MNHPDLLEGFARFSDAGVFRLREDLAIVQTVDFFPPIVDDPWDFGRIAAANSLSDCYAMGGKPVTALSIAGFPSRELDVSILGDIFAGAAEKVLESGAVVLGGHTVEDQEVKYGLAVTGTVHPGRIVSNAGARAGDALVLTKPLGMGTISTAIKKRKISKDALRRATDVMATLNRDAAEIIQELGGRGATDITGFGLLGHAREMALSSDVALRFEAAKVPLVPGVLDLAQAGLLSGGAARNRAYAGEELRVAPRVDPVLVELFLDSETSGGLLAALPPVKAEEMVRRLVEKGHAFAAVVGEVAPRGDPRLEVL
jgi:selenide,water dikinase